MRFDLRQLGRHKGGSLREEHVERTFQPSEFEASVGKDEEYTVAAPVHLEVDVHKDAEAYRVIGRVTTRLRLECGRCLEPFESPVDSAFELRYVPHVEPSPEGKAGTAEDEREVAEDDLTTAFYKEDSIHLGELMHEQFVLALPMKPLCRETCKGLCAHCGTNLNNETCDCAPQWTDPRLAVLKSLVKDRDN